MSRHNFLGPFSICEDASIQYAKICRHFQSLEKLDYVPAGFK